jgi:SAM-dependent methyltransferase
VADNPWHAEDYDSRYGFVSRLGDDLLELLGPVSGMRVLDLGCGTGRHAGELASRGADVVGLDADASMLDRARREHPGARYVQMGADVLSLPALGATSPFDACLSNAALHWMTDQEEVIRNVRSVLREGGRFVAEMGGAGNIATLDAALRSGLQDLGLAGIRVVRNYFPTVGQQSILLESCGFRVDLAAWFPRPTRLAEGDRASDWTRHFRAATWRAVPEDRHAELARAVDARATSLCRSDGWYADYCRLRFVAVAV